MKINKKFAILLLISVCLISFMACQKNNSKTETENKKSKIETQETEKPIQLEEIDIVKYDKETDKFKKVKVYSNELYNTKILDKLEGEYIQFDKDVYKNEEYKKDNYIFMMSKKDKWIPVTVENYKTGYECKVDYGSIKAAVYDAEEEDLVRMGEVTE